jgi:hypothetical protein
VLRLERACCHQGGAPAGRTGPTEGAGVSSASARLIAGRMVARRRASIDLPALGVLERFAIEWRESTLASAEMGYVPIIGTLHASENRYRAPVQ